MKKLILTLLLIAPIASAQESFVRLPADSVGKPLRMRTSTQGATLVYTQAFFLDDGSGSGPLGIAANPIFVNFAAGATTAITASSLPLPTGAATDATLTGGTAKTQIVSGGNTAGVNVSGQIAIQNAPNLDVALSTRLKPADTLTKVATVDTITNPVAASQSGAWTNTVTQTTGTNLHMVTDTGSVVSATIATDSVGLAKDATLTNGTQVVGTVTGITNDVPTKAGVVAAVTTSWTSATSSGTALTINTTGYSSALVTVMLSGSLTSGTVIMEGDDGSGNFFTISGVDVSAATLKSQFNLTSQQAFAVPVGNFTRFQVRTTSAIVGSGTANIRVAASAAPRDPSVASTITGTTTTQDTANGIVGSAVPARAMQIGGTDGTNLQRAVVKNTAATSSDVALVAQISPLSPLPSGSNTIGSVLISNAPPLLTAQQLGNPVLYRAAMRQFCTTNLCQPIPLGK